MQGVVCGSHLVEMSNPLFRSKTVTHSTPHKDTVTTMTSFISISDRHKHNYINRQQTLIQILETT